MPPSQKTIARFSHLMRTIEMEIGTSELHTLTLDALRDMIQSYKEKSLATFCDQIVEILEIFKNTQPKFSVVIDSFYTFLDHARNADTSSKRNFSECKEYLLKGVDALKITTIENYNQLLHHAKTLDVNDKNILIHDHSQSVQDCLWTLKKAGQKFRVIVAEQDPHKTLHIIEKLTEHNIPFHTVPAYMISNIESDIDICLFGSLTFKSTYDFVVDTGASAIISQCQLRKIPIYMIMTTSKFALWKASKREMVLDRNMHKHPWKDITFERLKFSHDRIPLSSIDWIITEKGVHTPELFQSLYEERLAQRQKQEEKDVT